MQSRMSQITNARAYVMIDVEAGQLAAVRASLHRLANIRAADVIIGPYDIIAVIEAPDPRAIGRIVIDEIHGITGVKRTTTSLVIR